MPGESPNESLPFLPRRLLVLWVATLGLAIVLGVGLGAERADYPTPFRVAHAYRLLVGGELFLLLVIVPLSAQSAIGNRQSAIPRVALLELIVLWVMAAPAVVIASWVADCDAAVVAASQAYLAVAAAFIAGYLRADRDGRFRAFYWLLVGALGAGAPILAFLVGDLIAAPLEWLYAFSPFWVADRLSTAWAFRWEWAAPSGALVLLAAALGVKGRGAATESVIHFCCGKPSGAGSGGRSSC